MFYIKIVRVATESGILRSPYTSRISRPIAVVLGLVFGLQACTTPEKWPQDPLVVVERTGRDSMKSGAVADSDLEKKAPAGTTISSLPKPPIGSEVRSPRQAASSVSTGNMQDAAVSLQSIALPQFIETIFATILKRNVSIDPQILQRKDVVSLKTGKPQSPDQLFAAARAVLRSYGISVQEFDGLVRFLPDNADSGYLPEIRRGRAMPEVPETLRPVFYLVELENTNISNAVQWLRTVFQAKITVQDDGPRNAIMVSGPPANVAAAMEAIRVLDQPLMRGRVSAKIGPAFSTPDELTRRINDSLVAEGYAPSVNANVPGPILLLPVAAINAIFVFAPNHAILNHVIDWAGKLDQPSQSRGAGNYFIYSARNTDATTLAKTLQEIVGTNNVTPQAGSVAGSAVRASKIVVNAATNSLIIQASAAEFQQWRELLGELDRPARSALISVTVADVSINDADNFGISFEGVLQSAVLNGLKFVVSTGPTGLSGAWLRTNSTITLPQSNAPAGSWTAVDPSNPKAVLTAYASVNKTRILSNPSLLTRSGETATISVGDDVPVLVSTLANTAGQTLTQTVQYRKTGVVLKVKPVVHSSGRIDLEVTQEVSNTAGSGVQNSPIIKSANLDTKLTVADGATVVLGGIMSVGDQQKDGGTTYLKDVPGVGALFKDKSYSQDKRELVMLITAYAVEDEYDTQAVVDAFRSRLPWINPLIQESGAFKSGTSERTVVPPLPADANSAGRVVGGVIDLRDPADKVPNAPSTPDSSGQKVQPMNFGAPAVAPTSAPRPQGTVPQAVAPTSAPPPSKQVSDPGLLQELLNAVSGGKP